MPLIVAILYKDIPLTLASKILMVVLLLIYFIGIILLFKIFTPNLDTFLQSLSEKIYFSLYTNKGEALSEKDFLILKNNNDTLYEYISSQKSRGCCYDICFEILRILKKGYIEFVAVKNISYIDDQEDDKSLTMHLIYVNNGWGFDTYSQRQFHIDKFYEIYQANFIKILAMMRLKIYLLMISEKKPVMNWHNGAIRMIALNFGASKLFKHFTANCKLQLAVFFIFSYSTHIQHQHYHKHFVSE